MRTYIFSAAGPQAESVRKLVRNKIIPSLVSFSLIFSSVPVRAFSTQEPITSALQAFTLEESVHEPLSAKPKTKHAFSHDLPENPISPLGTRRADFSIPEIANNLPVDAFTNLSSIPAFNSEESNNSATIYHTKHRTKRALPPLSSASASLSCTPPKVEPELAELARALNYDLSTIYEYVYYNIETSPLYGAQKSAFATYLDRRGTNIDQNVLFVTLLRQSCIEANYLQAYTTLSGDMLANHFKIFPKAVGMFPGGARAEVSSSTDSVTLFKVLLWGGWRACLQLEGDSSCVSDPTIKSLSEKKTIQVNLQRFWTEIKLKDKTYRLDPSLKSHTLQNPIHLAQAMGYDQKTFFDQALKGTSSLPHLDPAISSIKGIPSAEVKNLLNLYAQNLTEHLQRIGPDKKIHELFGGTEITSDLFAAELTPPAEVQIFENLPESFSTKFKVSLSEDLNKPVLFSQTFRADELGAQRLTLTYNALNQPLLMQEGKQIYLGPATTQAKQILTFEVLYPYPSRGTANNIPHQTGEATVEPGSTYALIFLAGESGRDRFTYHQRQLAENLNHPSSTLQSERIAGEALTGMGFAYLAQFARVLKRSDPLFQTIVSQYASLGVAGYRKGKGEIGSNVQDFSAPYVDFPISHIMSVGPDLQTEATAQTIESSARTDPKTGSNDSGARSFTTLALLGSILESTSVQQLQKNESVSTARLFDITNQHGNGFIEATQANWDKLVPHLTSWSNQDKADLKTFLQDSPENKVFLTENGQIIKNQWKGGAYYAFQKKDPQLSIQYKIAGGYAGGFGTQHASLSPPLIRDLSAPPTWTYTIQPQKSLDPIDLLTGDYVLDNEDVRLGKSNPAFDLVLTRSYHSGKSQELGPMGYGWTHNFDMKLLKDSDSFEALGEHLALAAVPTLVALTLIQELNKALTPNLSHVVLGSITASWLMDQLVDNALTLKVGNQSQKFIKIPTKNGKGRYLPPASSADQLIQNKDGSFLLTQKNGARLTFSKDGLLTKSQDRNNQTFQLFYDDQNRLIKVTNPAQRAFTFSYKSDGLIQDIFDQTYRVKYEYDQNKNLIQVTNKAGHSTKYAYDSQHKLTQFFTPSFPDTPLNVPLAGTPPANRPQAFVTNVYDGNGKIKTQTDANGNLWTYRFANRQRSQETDPYGNSRTFFYDMHGNQIKERDVEGLETKTTLDGLGRPIEILLPLGDKITQTFDAAHNLLSRTHIPIPQVQGHIYPPKTEQWKWNPSFHQMRSYQDANGHTTHYTYDARGNPATITYPRVEKEGRGLASPVKRLSYHLQGVIASERDAEGYSVKTYDYDLTTLERLKVTETSLKDRTSRSHSYKYDMMGNVIEETDPEGVKTEYSYDNSHHLIETQFSDPSRAKQSIAYDPDGRPVNWTEHGSSGPKVTSVTYTPSGKIASRTEPHLATTTYVYDKLDRLILETSPTGVKTHTTYDSHSNILERRRTRSASDSEAAQKTVDREPAEERRRRFTYDVEGQLTSDTSVEKQNSSYLYDQRSNWTKVTHGSATEEAQTKQEDTVLLEKRTYYPTGLLKSLQQGEGSGMGPGITFSYDGFKRLQFLFLSQKDKPSGEIYEAYAYDAQDQLIYKETRGHDKVYAIYDALGRRKSQIFLDASGTILPQITTTYDYTGRPQCVYRNPGKLCFVYDAFGRVSGEQQFKLWTHPHSLDVTWELDKNDRRTSLTWPTSHKVLYEYTPLGQLKNIKESTGYILGKYAYDSFGQRTQTILGDSPLRDSSLKVKYTYGANGQVEYIANQWKNGNVYHLFGHDADVQQVSRITSDSSYLPAKIKTQNAEFIANALNQYTDITKDGVKQVLTYDDNGNLKNFDGWTYKHNAFGQLVEAKKESVTATYTYDVLGRRNSKTVNGITTNYLWAGNQEIAEYDGDWNLLKRYVYGPGLDEPLAQIDSKGERHYFMTDKLGSIIGVMNDTGELVEKHAYTAFGVEVTRGDDDPLDGIILGEPRFCAADVAKKNGACVKDPVEAQKRPELHDKGSAFRFAGRRYDPETGLYYNRARYYSPMLGRFLQPDPIGVAGGLNLYAYANNNPVSYTDPMGDHPIATTAVPTLISGGGALVGLGIQAGMDLYRGERSSFGTYAGAAISWGIAGRGILSKTLAAALRFGAGAAGFGNAVEQIIDKGTNVDWAEVGISASVGTLMGGISYYIPSLPKEFLPYSPYAKGILTKMEKGIISQISTKTALKVFGTKILADHAITGSIAEEVILKQSIDRWNAPPNSRPAPVIGPTIGPRK